MARHSRRSFLGGVVGALTGWLGSKALPQAQAAQAPAAPTAPPLAHGLGVTTTLVWSANLPPGVTINSNTGLISGVIQSDGGSPKVS